MLFETWYRQDNEALRINGYQTYYVNGLQRRGGGMLLMVKSTLQSEIMQEFTKIIQAYEVLTTVSHKNVYSTVCRPPCGSVTTFLHFLDVFFSWINDNDFNLVLEGDFNMNMLNATSDIHDLVTMLESHACINTVKAPTRIQANSATLIDVFITNMDPATLVCGVIGVTLAILLAKLLMFYEPTALKAKAEVHVSAFQDINALTLTNF